MQYTFTKSPVNIDRLTKEIQDSSITIAIDYIQLDGVDSLTIYFKASLTEIEQATLSTIVTNHSGEPLPNDVIVKIEGEVTPKTQKNEHCMEPWGCTKGYYETMPLQGDQYVCEITLSNKSQDGLTFTYSATMIPEIGNYIFQNHETRRSWVTAVDTQNQTLTVELPDLENGTGVYSKGFYVDCLVRDWKPMMYLWGVTISVKEYEDGVLEEDPCGDFLEFSIVDKYDLFKNDDFCLAVFGVNAAAAVPYIEAEGFEDNGEYGHYTKYYDESWVLNCNSKLVKTIDGAPGGLLANLWLRTAFFTTEDENHQYHIYIDYYPTSRD